MLSTPPPLTVRRYRRQPRLPMPTPPAPPPAAITVVSVTRNVNDLTWTFSAAVTLTGANVPQLENDIDGTSWWQSPTSCVQGAANQIIATYNDEPGETTPWRIASALSNVAESASITVPQSGTIG